MTTGFQQHFLVESVDADCGKFTAYTTQGGGKVVKVGQTWGHGDTTLMRIDYDRQSNAYHPAKALEEAARQEVVAGNDECKKTSSKWQFSDEFVSFAKCGRPYVITEKCILRGDLEPVGCTLVTPHVAVDVGDHLVVKTAPLRVEVEKGGEGGGGEGEEFRSVLVYSCLSESTLITMPDLFQKEPLGKLSLSNYDGGVYRVNYPKSLPASEVLKRCCTSEGLQMLSEEEGGGGGGGVASFVSWAKTGQRQSISMSKLIDQQLIAMHRPSEYEKLLSPKEIRVGDHLFIPNLAYRWHFLVTENPGSRSDCTFDVIYCLRGTVKETRERIDPISEDVFRVVYPEEYPPSLAAKRARSLLGKVNLSPTARMWFVRWAKTGSEEGLEADFLKRRSLPVAKSRVVCFTQLDPGDYLVEDKGRFFVRRHYVVTEVHSPTSCAVVGAWKGRVQETTLTLDDDVAGSPATYHRIFYEEAVCVRGEEAVRRAREAMTAPFRPKLFRRKFPNYVKTTDSCEVDVEGLSDHRVLLQRERVESVEDLRPGDHVERLVRHLQRVSYEDMIVTSSSSSSASSSSPSSKVMVLCLASQDGRRRLVETEFDVGSASELYRVKYLERVGPAEGIETLRRAKDGAPLSVSINGREHA